MRDVLFVRFVILAVDVEVMGGRKVARFEVSQCESAVREVRLA